MGQWYVEMTNVDRCRFDAVKHVRSLFFPEWLQHVRQTTEKRLFAVGEYWSGNVEALHHFIEPTGGDVALFDAPLHYNFSRASKAGQAYDLRTVFDNTLVKDQPTLALTLVENHDSQPLQSLESVVEAWFKPMAYALILLRRAGRSFSAWQALSLCGFLLCDMKYVTENMSVAKNSKRNNKKEQRVRS